MEELKAIIEEDGRIRCPVCKKVNGRVTGNEFVVNYRIRCRASKRGAEHYFRLFAGNKENIKTISGGAAL